MLAYLDLELGAVIDTHTHADHRTATFDLRDLTGARVIMHRLAAAPNVDVHVEDGQTIAVGDLALEVLHTPGHTPDGISLHAADIVFTGDTLLIRGTGRADFAGGDAGAQYDAIMGRLFTLPDEIIVLPARDYRGHTQSTIGEERRANPRLAGKSREQYVQLMANLGLPLPGQDPGGAAGESVGHRGRLCAVPYAARAGASAAAGCLRSARAAPRAGARRAARRARSGRVQWRARARSGRDADSAARAAGRAWARSERTRSGRSLPCAAAVC
jgi:hypothetical protein